MEITVPVEIMQIKRGLAARALSPPLTGHGEDREEALGALEKGALAWAFSLQRAGRLDKAIARYGLDCEPIRPHDIHMRLTVTVDEAAPDAQLGAG